MPNSVSVTVVIASMLAIERAQLIQRAIDSCRNQQELPIKILLVVNGARVDSGLLASIASQPNVKVLRREEGNLPKALAAGVAAVDTRFFCFLDDDDRLLPDSIKIRLAPMLKDDSIDMVVADGLVSGQKGYARFAEAGADYLVELERNPLQGLIRSNWLASCGGMYRSDRFRDDFFDDHFRYLEWTYWAIKLSVSRKIAFIPGPCFELFDTPNSLSKSESYRMARVELLRRLETLAQSFPAIKEYINATKAAAYHELAEYYLSVRHRPAAFRAHLASLFAPNGVRYLSFTRHLLS